MAVARKIDAFNAAYAGAKLARELCTNKSNTNPLVNLTPANIISHGLQISKICSPWGFAAVEVYNLISSYPRNYIEQLLLKLTI